MPGFKNPRKYHSEERWQRMPPTIVRCHGTLRDGAQCRAVAEAGAVVCKTHGGAAPQVKARAAQRVLMTADEAARSLVAWMHDPAVPFPTRVKIATDLMDRAGLNATHNVELRAQIDPVEVMLKHILEDPEGMLEAPRRAGVVDAHVIDDDTPDVPQLLPAPARVPQPPALRATSRGHRPGRDATQAVQGRLDP